MTGKELELLPWLLKAMTGVHEDQILAGPRYRDPRSLARYRSQVYSQSGEDGAIAEIMRRLGVGRGRFLEIGAGNGQQNNTRFLLECGWTGVWIEADKTLAAGVRSNYPSELADGRLVLIEDLVDRANVMDLLRPYLGMPVDLLSIDVDMNTSHIWRAIRGLEVKAAVVEYNPSLPPSVGWEVPYHPRALWSGDNYFGASLKTLEEIARAKGLCLVGCDLAGINAFFVQEEFATAEQFLQPFTAEFHYEPPRFALTVCSSGHPPHQRQPVSALRVVA